MSGGSESPQPKIRSQFVSNITSIIETQTFSPFVTNDADHPEGLQRLRPPICLRTDSEIRVEPFEVWAQPFPWKGKPAVLGTLAELVRNRARY